MIVPRLMTNITKQGISVQRILCALLVAKYSDFLLAFRKTSDQHFFDALDRPVVPETWTQ